MMFKSYRGKFEAFNITFDSEAMSFKNKKHTTQR